MTEPNSSSLTEENRLLSMFRPAAGTQPQGRRYLDQLHRNRQEGLEIRPYRESDRRELVQLAVVLNERVETALQFPAGRNSEEILDALTRINLEQRMLVLQDAEGRLRGFAGVSGQDRLADTGTAQLFGPAVEPSLQRNGQGRLLLNHAEDLARSLGFQSVSVELSVRNVAGADFLMHCNYPRGERRYLLQARRATRTHFFKKPEDRVYVLEAGDDPELAALIIQQSAACGFAENDLRSAQRDSQCCIFVASRHENARGLLILDLARPRLAVIRQMLILTGPEREEMLRLLYVSACRAAFSRNGVLAVETRLQEGSDGILSELDSIGFRLVDTCRVFSRNLSD